MILSTGEGGQVGTALTDYGKVIGLADYDLTKTDPNTVLERFRPHAVINAAAFTGVDRAESEREAAFAINATGAMKLAHACRARGIPFVQISTDYVFDGTSSIAYNEDDRTSPLNVYGESKEAGERAVLLAGGTIMRTSWVFSSVGSNFLKTILRLAGEQKELRIVADQHGCPTHASEVARMAVALTEQPAGIYHACGAPATTWHQFAKTIVDEARKRRKLVCERVTPITTAEFPTPAKRPMMSVLDTSKLRAKGIVPAPWLDGVRQSLVELLP